MLAGTVMGEIGAHNIFYGDSILWLVLTVMGEVGPITYFTEPALLSFAESFE